MLINVLKSKIQAYVTETNVNYYHHDQDSIFISKYYLNESGILPNELVHVYNITNGNRIQTYVIDVKLYSIDKKNNHNEFFINGGAAHLFKKGDKIVIASFAMINDVEYHGSWLTKKHKPTMVIV